MTNERPLHDYIDMEAYDVVSGEVHRTLIERAWEVMGRAVADENGYGDNIGVTMSIDDWRELCEIMRFGQTRREQ